MGPVGRRSIADAHETAIRAVARQHCRGSQKCVMVLHRIQASNEANQPLSFADFEFFANSGARSAVGFELLSIDSVRYDAHFLLWKPMRSGVAHACLRIANNQVREAGKTPLEIIRCPR